MKISKDQETSGNQTKAAGDDHSSPAAQQSATSQKAAGTGFWSRRRLISAGVIGIAGSFVHGIRRSWGQALDNNWNALPHDAPVEYIVVGSGPGGGPLACNLARAGHKVVLFEAGGDEGDQVASVPFFAGATTEDAAIRWDYYVRHWADNTQQSRDPKFYPQQNGVWYPRVGSVGGCSLHSFMVDIYPSDSDWQYIQELTGDHTWNPRFMRRYFEHLEKCLYVPQEPGNPSRHGFKGWQPTEFADATVYDGDSKVSRILQAAASVAGDIGFSIGSFFAGLPDINDWRLRQNREGVAPIPLFTKDGQRYGPRQYIRETQVAMPDRLIVMTHCLVTRVLFQGTTAMGVEYIPKERVYRADPNTTSQAQTPLPETQQMYAVREVVLAAGTFNTPQLLKLSGIGPADELANHGITPIVDLPGVGQSLQDRYEIGVVTNLTSDFQFAAACRPGQATDPCYASWLQGKGPYTGYGAPGGVLLKSPTAQATDELDPDLLISVALTRFKGYYHGYSSSDLAGPDASHQMTWIILKAHTLNRAGTVELRSADPRDTPLINFHYFEEGSPGGQQDLSALVDAVEYARRCNAELAGIANAEIVPGPSVQTRDEIAQFIRDEAWGHHASSTCRIGPRSDRMAVVDSRFNVHGTQNLRIVDASVFPRIPGYFILLPIYMISQKASEIMIERSA